MLKSRRMPGFRPTGQNISQILLDVTYAVEIPRNDLKKKHRPLAHRYGTSEDMMMFRLGRVRKMEIFVRLWV